MMFFKFSLELRPNLKLHSDQSIISDSSQLTNSASTVPLNVFQKILEMVTWVFILLPCRGKVWR